MKSADKKPGRVVYVLCLVFQVYTAYRKSNGRRASIRLTKNCLHELFTLWFIFTQYKKADE